MIARPLWLVLTAAAVLVCAGACGATERGTQPRGALDLDTLKPADLGSTGMLRVVATTTIVSDVVKQIGRDRIELTTLMGAGVDPHTYVAAPGDAAAIHEAHVVFANGAGLEAFLDELLGNVGGSAIIVELSDGLELRELVGEADHGETGEGHDHEEYDPHVWFDVQNVMAWTQAIELALARLDPAGAEAYAEHAAAYAAQLQALDRWVVEQIATIPAPQRRMVTSHLSFGYLAERYGLEQVGAIYPISPSAEPSARDIARLEDAIRDLGVAAVFTESTVSDRLAEQVARDTGVKVIPLYSGSLGVPGSGVESYLDLVRYDVQAIVEALR